MSNPAREYIETLKKLLKDNEHAQKYYGWVLDRGESFAYQELTPAEKESLRGLRTAFRCKARQCFYNAQKMALFYPEKFDYIEGWGFSIIPTEHAWVTFKGSNKVVDFTWEKVPNGKSAMKNYSYFGLRIPSKLIAQHWAKTKMAGPVIVEYYEETHKL